MISVEDTTYRTIEDAAKEFRVSPKTVAEWIKRGIIDSPPEFEYGVRSIRHFSSDYMKKAKADLQRYRKKQKRKS